MPELPEVQTIVDGLKKAVLGKTIRSLEILSDRNFPVRQHLAELQGATIKGIERRGKSILIELSHELVLFTHLKMTGQLVYERKDLPSSATRLIYTFTDGSRLFYNDLRKFGYMKLLKKSELSEIDFLKTVGPEPLSEEFTEEVLKQNLQRRKHSPLKAALLDQSVVAGIGNIYADESIFLAKLDPRRAAGSLTEAEISALYEAIRNVLKVSLKLRGSTRLNYVDAEGKRGGYLDNAYVYGREGLPCRICGQLLEKSVAAGRGTHTCPGCQKPKALVRAEDLQVAMAVFDDGEPKAVLTEDGIVLISGSRKAASQAELLVELTEQDRIYYEKLRDQLRKKNIRGLKDLKDRVTFPKEWQKMQQNARKEADLHHLRNYEEFLWKHEKTEAPEPYRLEDIKQADQRLRKFAPFFEAWFPETRAFHGLIESELLELHSLKLPYAERLFVKADHDLPIAGSVKARGGIYEVLSHAEDIIRNHGLLDNDPSYEIFGTKAVREILKAYTVEVATTGNLGLSIGLMSRALGFQVKVHMSDDAKAWKKDLLRAQGADVIEYADNYSKAVEEGRKASLKDPSSYFVDDERSERLFLGYAVAALRLEEQLKAQGLLLSPDDPLRVVIPCGVGGAPGGIAYGLKLVFGEHVRVYFAEPTHAPCLLLGMLTKKYDRISVSEIGLDGRTIADGLAVQKASGLVSRLMESRLEGIVTVSDEHMLNFVRTLYESEGLKVEPSATAGFFLPEHLKESANYLIWTTGGRLVPEKEFRKYLKGVR